jgi:hypothetical protein
MAVTHSTAARNAIANAAVDLLDIGSGANGTLVFLTTSDVVVATLGLSDPAFGAADAGAATAGAITSDTNAVGGITTKFELRNKNDVAVIFGSVGTSGQDINLSSVSVGAGDTVAITNLTYTAAP